MKIEKNTVIWILIVLSIFISSYFFDPKKNTSYLQSDIYDFQKKYLTLIICIVTAIIILSYLIILKFKIRDKIKGILVFSFYSLAMVVVFRTLLFSLLLSINRLGASEELKIDYYYFKELELLYNIKTGKVKGEDIITSTVDFKNVKKVKYKEREIVSLKFRKGLLGINYLK